MGIKLLVSKKLLIVAALVGVAGAAVFINDLQGASKVDAFPETPRCTSAATGDTILLGQQGTEASPISVSGDTATVNFKYPGQCRGITTQFALVSYMAPNTSDNRPYNLQRRFAASMVSHSNPGNFSMQVKVPDCRYQVDFVIIDRNNPIIEQFNEAADVTYGNQHRLIKASGGNLGKPCPGIGPFPTPTPTPQPNPTPPPPAPAPTPAPPTPTPPSSPTVNNTDNSVHNNATNNTNVNGNNNVCSNATAGNGNTSNATCTSTVTNNNSNNGGNKPHASRPSSSTGSSTSSSNATSNSSSSSNSNASANAVATADPGSSNKATVSDSVAVGSGDTSYSKESSSSTGTLPNTGPGPVAAFGFGSTFMSTMLYAYRGRYAGMLARVIARF